MVYSYLFQDFTTTLDSKQVSKMFGPLITITKKKVTEPGFYKRAVKYIYKVYNGLETRKQQDEEF